MVVSSSDHAKVYVLVDQQKYISLCFGGSAEVHIKYRIWEVLSVSPRPAHAVTLRSAGYSPNPEIRRWFVNGHMSWL